MRTPANVAKHPIHPMLVAVPIGLWLFSLICDLFFYFGSGGENWQVVAAYTIAGGIVGALVAAIPGFIDLLSLPWSLKRIALLHMSLNLTVVALYVVNYWLRSQQMQAGAQGMAPFWLSLVAVLMLAASGWLGGKLVYVHGVAVETPPEPAPAGKHPLGT